MTKRVPLERLRQLSMARYARKAHAPAPAEADRYVEGQQQWSNDMGPSSVCE
jgi:hypothetical protein